MRGRKGLTLAETARVSGLPLSLVRRVARGRGFGDTSRVAVALGVAPSTVRRWRSTGVPAKRLESLVTLVADLQATKVQEAKERIKVSKLIKKAKKAGILPRTKPKGTKKFAGERAFGVKTISHLNQYLSYDTLRDIETNTLEAPKGPRYIVTVMAVEAGITGKVRGYGGTITKKLGKQAENVSFSSAITSGSWSTRRKALQALFGKLRDAIQDADALIYITDLSVFSYRRRDKT